MKTFNETQMRDPWSWCLDMIEKHNVSSRMLSEAIDAPRSTVRALFNGSNRAPRYELLTQMVSLFIDLENGVPGPWLSAPGGGSTEDERAKGFYQSQMDADADAETEKGQEWDFL